ncbi:hypothetical protein CFE70_003775 [Pyrenophora teres f. teres 0-1]
MARHSGDGDGSGFARVSSPICSVDDFLCTRLGVLIQQPVYLDNNRNRLDHAFLGQCASPK